MVKNERQRKKNRSSSPVVIITILIRRNLGAKKKEQRNRTWYKTTRSDGTYSDKKKKIGRAGKADQGMWTPTVKLMEYALAARSLGADLRHINP